MSLVNCLYYFKQTLHNLDDASQLLLTKLITNFIPLLSRFITY